MDHGEVGGGGIGTVPGFLASRTSVLGQKHVQKHCFHPPGLSAVGIISPPLPHRKHPQTTDLVGMHPGPPPATTAQTPYSPKGYYCQASTQRSLFRALNFSSPMEWECCMQGTLRSTCKACDHQLQPSFTALGLSEEPRERNPDVSQ